MGLKNGFLKNFFRKCLGNAKDVAIISILKAFNIKYSLTIYELIKYSPIDQIVLLLSTKLGLPKMAVFLIILIIIWMRSPNNLQRKT